MSSLKREAHAHATVQDEACQIVQRPQAGSRCSRPVAGWQTSAEGLGFRVKCLDRWQGFMRPGRPLWCTAGTVLQPCCGTSGASGGSFMQSEGLPETGPQHHRDMRQPRIVTPGVLPMLPCCRLGATRARPGGGCGLRITET